MPENSVLPRLPFVDFDKRSGKASKSTAQNWQTSSFANGTSVTIVIPTFRRNAYLKKAIESCLGQRTHSGAPFEILVVDNSPERLAEKVVSGYGEEAIEVRYCHEPRPGISHARNRGFAEARGAFLALLDDDEIAHAGWLLHLSQTQARYQADVVFGPVLPHFEHPPKHDLPFFTAFYTYSLEAASGSEVGVRATNNAYIRRACLDDETNDPFDASLGLTGGEDTLFFTKLQARDAKFVWSSEATVEEAIAPGRTEWRAVWERAFQRGQCRASTPMLLSAPRPDRTLFWMAFGAFQLMALLPLAALLWLPNRQHALICTWKAISGLGKILWMKRFRKQAYGAKKEVSKSWRDGLIVSHENK